MITHEEKIVHSFLDTIHSEIINLSCSIGECKSAIEHNESLLYRVHDDLKSSINKIDDKVDKLERAEYARQKKLSFWWKLFSISPGNIFKWASCLVTLIYLIIYALRVGIPEKLMQIFQFTAG